MGRYSETVGDNKSDHGMVHDLYSMAMAIAMAEWPKGPHVNVRSFMKSP